MTDEEWRRFLTSHWFSFGKRNQAPYTSNMWLTSDGFVQGYTTWNETRWEVKDHILSFLNGDSVPTTQFDLNEANPEAITVEPIIGHYLKKPDVEHVLRVQSAQTVINRLMIAQGKQFERTFSEMSRRSRAPKSHDTIRVVILYNAVETLPATLSLVKAIRADARFECKVIVTDKHYTGENIGGSGPVTKVLRNEGIPFVLRTTDLGGLLKDIELYQPDFILRQSHWDSDWPSELAAKNLDWSRLFAVSYIIDDGFLPDPDNPNKYFVTNDYYRHVWRYFGPKLTDEEKKDVRSSLISESIFQDVGSIKALQIKQAQPEWPIEGDRKRILWIAHHSINNWFHFGNFPQMYHEMYDWIKTHPEYSVVFNPHPLLSENILAEYNKLVDTKAYNQFLKDMRSLPNADVWIKKPQYPVAQAADVVLTDGVSSLYEMQILNKPIVSWINPKHSPFSEFAKHLMRGVHRAYSMEEVEQLVDYYAHHEDELRPIQEENTAAWLSHEHPEQEIIDTMVEEMRRVGKVGF